MNKKIVGLGLAAVATLALGACSRSNSSSSSSDSSVKAAIITDTGGVDDKSFNQSAWEGLQEWGKANKLKKDSGFTYFQSNSESDFCKTICQLLKAKVTTSSLVLVSLFMMLLQMQLKNTKMLTMYH